MENNKLKCGNTNCDYCVSIENDAKIKFKCKNCLKDFYSYVKIYNPLEIIHFKDVVDKALLYKRKAYPGKLSCCSKIKEKRTDFFHKNECKGKIYFGEYNHKILIVCSKCRAVNQYSKFIWTCPECGIHFRDKKSKENEIKIRKTKSSNRLVKSQKLLSFLEEDNYLTLNNNNKRPLADLLSTRKNNKEKNSLYNSYNFDNITERKKPKKNKILSEKILCETDEHIDKNIKVNGIQKKKKRKYIIRKILPWTSPRKTTSNTEENNENNNNSESKNNEEKKEYYDKKVNDLINPKQIDTKIEVDRKIDEDHIYVCRSGRVNYKNNEININLNMKDSYNNKIEKGKNLYARRYNGLSGLKNNYDSAQSTKKILNNFNNHNQTSIETNYVFNKMKSPAVRNIKKDNDLKCKKFVPIKLKYLYNTEHETKHENNNNNVIKGKNLLKLFESQNIKKLNQIDINIKKDSKNKKIYIENKNNKESWQSKETTTKGSIESKNSIISHSPQKDEEDENKKMYKNKLFLNNDNLELHYKKIEKDKILDREDDIIPEDMVDQEQDIIIENKNIKENKNLYDNIQRRLKRILKKGRLPRFDLDKYHIDRQIGDGSFGIIFLVHHKKSKNKYAMKKIIANNINSLELYQKEFEIAHHNRHPSILDIKGIYLKCFDTTTYVLYVLMDLAERDWEVEINHRLKNNRYYKEKELISILKQLSSALYFLQKEKSVAHRDIKPENVLIFKKIVNNRIKYGEYLYKLCDFGEAKDFSLAHSKKKNKTLRGTELYMSPALYNGLMNESPYVNHDAFKSDVFSLGCCMIIASNLDFEIINEIRELKDQIKIMEFLNEKMLGKYSEKFIEVILKMINFNEKERIDFIQLQEIIESTF